MPCQSSKLVVYKVTFETFWDREKFPKQYPEWRPPAQWSKLVGKQTFFEFLNKASESLIAYLSKDVIRLQAVLDLCCLCGDTKKAGAKSAKTEVT